MFTSEAIMSLANIAVICVFLAADANPKARHRHGDLHKGQEPSANASIADAPRTASVVPVEHSVQDKQEKIEPQTVIVVSMPAKGWTDWVMFAGNVAVVFVGIGGIVVAICTLLKIERQTKATETQAKHMVESERPFLMVEVIGNSESVHFKISNAGRSPAKILYVDKLLLPRIISISENPPPVPDYGIAYENATIGAELLNPDWIAPGSNICTGSYQPRMELAMIPEDEQRVKSGSHLVWIYGVVVYKGLFSDGPYESRYCYRLGNGSWHMLGPCGYNEYK